MRGFIKNEYLAKSSSDIAKIITECDPVKEFTYIILGETGETGKTSLCTWLRDMGYTAFEIAEEINDKVYYLDDQNRLRIDATRMKAVIILNKRFVW